MKSDQDAISQQNKLLKQQLDAANQEISALKASQIEVLTRLSHELNTPLNIIIGYARLFEAEQLSKEQQENIHQILTSANYLHKQTAQLLKLAELKSQQLPLEMVAIGDMLSAAMSLVERTASEKAVHIFQCIPSENLLVETYQVCFEQVLVNLLINAIHYSPKHGTVSLTCEENNGLVKITVQDQGQGIPDELKDSVFNLFHDRNIDHVEGLELGLYLAKEYVELLGGNIDFESEQDHGAAFWITLPKTIVKATHD